MGYHQREREDRAAKYLHTCDLDGNGTLDNAIADLGSPGSELFSGFLNGWLESRYAQASPMIFHFPWIDDRDRPEDAETELIVAATVDTDLPRNREDNFSGDEPFIVEADSLDPCGEPLNVISHIEITDGAVETRVSGVFPFRATEDLPLRRASMTGAVEPGFTGEGSWTVCGVATIYDAGSRGAAFADHHLSFLAAFLGGGSSFGMPGIPGLTPDVDLDGDGLERLELDAEGQVATCIDGDMAVIAGPDCWQDSRMADGFSTNASFRTTTGACVGRELLAEGSCTAPPAASLWGEGCRCSGPFSAFAEELRPALDGVEVEGVDESGSPLGRTLPVIEIGSGVALATGLFQGAPTEATAWAEGLCQRTDACPILVFDLNAEGDEAPFDDGTTEWASSALMVRRSYYQPLGDDWTLRVDAAATAADLNLVSTTEGSPGIFYIDHDYGGADDSGIHPHLEPQVRRIKEEILDFLRTCQEPEG